MKVFGSLIFLGLLVILLVSLFRFIGSLGYKNVRKGFDMVTRWHCGSDESGVNK